MTTVVLLRGTREEKETIARAQEDIREVVRQLGGAYLDELKKIARGEATNFSPKLGDSFMAFMLMTEFGLLRQKQNAEKGNEYEAANDTVRKVILSANWFVEFN